MNSKLLIWLALVLSGGLCGCSTVYRHTSAVSPVMQQIVKRMSNYYEHLSSFEGTNTIIDQSPTYKMTRTKQFAFLRPNQFVIRPGDTNDPQLFCDGTNLYDYRPYYFNSYTKSPAPVSFEEAITNWIGGELVYRIISTNRLRQLMTGFGQGMAAWKNEGNQIVDGVTCHHLLMREPGSHTVELWIAAGASPIILKYVSRYPVTAPAKGVWIHTETISGWRANISIPPEHFAFVPPAGAIEHPSNANVVQTSVTFSNGVEKQEVKFTSDDELDKLRRFLKKNREHFQTVALNAILVKYTDLTTNDLTFLSMEPSFPQTGERAFVITYALPKTQEITNGDQFIQSREQTIAVTLKPDGTVKAVSGASFSLFRSVKRTKPQQVHPKSP